jgi:hypothetical protein
LACGVCELSAFARTSLFQENGELCMFLATSPMSLLRPPPLGALVVGFGQARHRGC